ncbi:MAG: Lrp/AsnC family transcriptional regulator [Pseudomonadota bacterium]
MGQEKTTVIALTPIKRRLLNDYQQGLPLSATPFADIAQQLGISEQKVINHLEQLQQQGFISRVGPVFRTHSIGASTLAAMSAPPEHIEATAEIINRFSEVNHNYEREHELNLWFVVTAPDEAHLAHTLQRIERQTGYEVLSLPMLEDYHIDLGFELQWT